MSLKRKQISITSAKLIRENKPASPNCIIITWRQRRALRRVTLKINTSPKSPSLFTVTEKKICSKKILHDIYTFNDLLKQDDTRDVRLRRLGNPENVLDIDNVQALVTCAQVLKLPRSWPNLIDTQDGCTGLQYNIYMYYLASYRALLAAPAYAARDAINAWGI